MCYVSDSNTRDGESPSHGRGDGIEPSVWVTRTRQGGRAGGGSRPAARRSVREQGHLPGRGGATHRRLASVRGSHRRGERASARTEVPRRGGDPPRHREYPEFSHMGKTGNLLVGPTAELLFIRNYLCYLEYHLNSLKPEIRF